MCMGLGAVTETLYPDWTGAVLCSDEPRRARHLLLRRNHRRLPHPRRRVVQLRLLPPKHPLHFPRIRGGETRFRQREGSRRNPDDAGE